MADGTARVEHFTTYAEVYGADAPRLEHFVAYAEAYGADAPRLEHFVAYAEIVGDDKARLQHFVAYAELVEVTDTPATKILIDWDGDGTFTDESSYFVRADGERRLVSAGKAILGSKGIIPRATLTLDNTTSRFSPLNESGDLYDDIKDGGAYQRRVIVKRKKVESSEYEDVFVGVIKIPKETGPTAGKASVISIECRGLEDEIMADRASTSLSQFVAWRDSGATEAEILSQWFTDAGWGTAQLLLDNGLFDIDWAWLDDESPIENAWQLAIAVGGRVYTDRSGTIRYENNQHWLLGAHKIDQGTLTRSASGSFNPTYHDRDLYEQVNVQIVARDAVDVDVMWEPADIIQVPSLGTVEVIARFQQPAYSITEVTYNAATSGGDDLDAEVSLARSDFAQRSTLTFTNTHATQAAIITALTVSGRPSDGYDSDEVNTKSTASFWTGRTGRERVIRNPYIQSQSAASFLSSYLGSWHEEPTLFFKTGRVVGTATRELGDRYELNDGSVMTNPRDAFITAIQWSIGSEGFWQSLDLVDAVAAFPFADSTPGYFIIGTNTLGTSDAGTLIPGRVFF